MTSFTEKHKIPKLLATQSCTASDLENLASVSGLPRYVFFNCAWVENFENGEGLG